MADPKYAGLPGIVCDQPDVYETSDLPESDQDQQGRQELGEADGEAMSPAFEVLHVTASEAAGRFKGASLRAGDVDFSDRLTARHRTGYPSNRPPIEWSVVPRGGDDEEETVVERYQRLQCEAAQLQQEVQQMQGSVPHGPGGGVSAVALSASVDELQATLRGLDLDRSLGPEVVSAIAHPDVVLHKKLLTLLESFKKTGLVSKKEGGASPGASGGGGIVYELYYAPEHARLNQMARNAHLEKRLDRLETLVGAAPDKMSVLSTWTNHRSLLVATQVLSTRLSLLDPAHLDHVEGRLHAVHTRMNALGERKAAPDDSHKHHAKVAELHEAARKCETMCATLPELVDRLAGVEELHHEAAQFGRSLRQLDTAQTQLRGALGSNEALLAAVRDKLERNLATVEANMAALDRRIQALVGTPAAAARPQQ